MDKSPIEIAIGQTNILIEDEVCKAVGKVGIHINKEELLKALKAYEFVEELTNYIFEYPDDDYMTMECLCRKLVKYHLMSKVDGYYIADRKTEPTISRMEQVDKDINVRSKDEPQIDGAIDEARFKAHCMNCQRDVADIKCLDCDGDKYFIPDEPQTSKIIEAYSRGFKDGADAVKSIPQTDMGTSDTVYSDTAGYIPRADMTDCSWK